MKVLWLEMQNRHETTNKSNVIKASADMMNATMEE